MATLGSSVDTGRRSTLRKALFWLFSVLGVILFIFSAFIWETVDLSKYHVKQEAVTGDMSTIRRPQTYWQMFGTISEYQAAGTFFFSKHFAEGGDLEESIPIRFNDGGQANITGNVRFILPDDDSMLISLHKSFRSYENFVNQAVRQVVSEAVILTAALMASEESYTTKRSSFSEMAWDQVRYGIYLTEEKKDTIKDPATHERTLRSRVVVKRYKDGKPMRKENPLAKYNIGLSQFVIKEIDYEEGIETQISSKRTNIMAIITARARGEQAQFERLQAEEEGKYNVTIAKYDAEKVKIVTVIGAERQKKVVEILAEGGLKVAQFDRQAAEQNKIRDILEGEGDSYYKRKIIEADRALDVNLEAYKFGHRVLANAYESGQTPFPNLRIFNDSKGLPSALSWDALNINALKSIMKPDNEK